VTSQATAERPSLWRNRDFAALWGGQVVSNLGASISGTAMPLLVLTTTGSPSDAGLVAAPARPSDMPHRCPRDEPARRSL
jgi:hypothetical protein